MISRHDLQSSKRYNVISSPIDVNIYLMRIKYEINIRASVRILYLKRKIEPTNLVVPSKIGGGSETEVRAGGRTS